MSELMNNPKLRGLMGDMADQLEADGCGAEANLFRDPLSEQEYGMMHTEFQNQVQLWKGKKKAYQESRANADEPIKADARRDRAREQALLQSQRLKERQQRAAHHDFELSRQSNNLEALKNEYQVECAHPGGHASSVGTNFEVT